MNCKKCGAEISPDANFCISCGASLIEQSQSEPPQLPKEREDLGVKEKVEPKGDEPELTPEAPAKRKRKRRVLLGGLLVVVLAVALILGVVWISSFGGPGGVSSLPSISGDGFLKNLIPSIKDIANIFGGSPKEMLVLFEPFDDNELMLLKRGQDKGGILLLEDKESLTSMFIKTLEGEFINTDSRFGIFLPQRDTIYLWYGEEEDGSFPEFVLQEMEIGGEEPEVVMSSEDARQVMGTIIESSDVVFLKENRREEKRCYTQKLGREAELIAEGDNCFLSEDGSRVIIEVVEEGRSTLSAVDIESKEERILLDGIGGVESYRVSKSGSFVAYTREEDGNSVLYLVGQSSGEGVNISGEVFNLLDFNFGSQSGDLFFITEEINQGESVLNLHLYGQDDNPIAQGTTLAASFIPGHRSLAYLVGDENGEETLYVYSLSKNDKVEVLSGEDLQYGVLETPSVGILAVSSEDDEFTLYGVSPDGEEVVELLDESGQSLNSIQEVRGEDLFYVVTQNEDNERSLFVIPGLDQEGYELIEEWAGFGLWKQPPERGYLVFIGSEDQGDDPVLYSVRLEEGAEPIALDDDVDYGVRGAVLSPDGQEVIYNAYTGNDFDELEVRQVRVDGEEEPEVLYEDAVLADVRWGVLSRFTPGLIWKVFTENVYETTEQNRIAFSSDRDGEGEIFVMNFEGTEVLQLTENQAEDMSPLWSPDGRRIAFLTGDWETSRDVQVVNADGSGLINLTADMEDEVCGWHRWSPTGRQLLFTSDRDGDREIYLINADGSGLVQLTDNSDEESAPVWSPDGRIMYVSQREDYDEIIVMQVDGSGKISFKIGIKDVYDLFWSPDGKHLVILGDDNEDNFEYQLYLMDGGCMSLPEECQGSVVQLTEGDSWNFYNDWSPDSDKILFDSNRSGDWKIYVMDVASQDITQLTFGEDGHDWNGRYSGGGKYIVFSSDRDGDEEIYIMTADGSNLHKVTDNDVDDTGPDFWP